MFGINKKNDKVDNSNNSSNTSNGDTGRQVKSFDSIMINPLFMHKLYFHLEGADLNKVEMKSNFFEHVIFLNEQKTSAMVSFYYLKATNYDLYS